MKSITIPAYAQEQYQVVGPSEDRIFIVQSHAIVKIVTVLDATAAHIQHTIMCHDNSNVQYECIITGGNHSLILDIQLLGAHAQVTIGGAYTLSENEVVTFVARQAHYAPHTKSELQIKGVLSGHARIAYDGAIYVDLPAYQAQAGQKNITLLVSDNARVTSNPSLEVLTNDVHCAHGSAVGALDEQQLFYLQSRGMDYQQARTLLLQGFFSDYLQHNNLVDGITRVLQDGQ